MSFVLVGVMLQFGSMILAMGSYFVAMLEWQQAVADSTSSPELGLRGGVRRQVEDPLGTWASVPGVILKRNVLKLRQSSDPTVEAWRRLMWRRAFLGVLLTSIGLGLPFTGWLLDQIASRAAESGAAVGYVILAMDVALVGGVVGTIGVLALRYARGHLVRRSAGATWVLSLGAAWLVLVGQLSIGVP